MANYFSAFAAQAEDDDLLQQACVLIQSTMRGRLARVQFKKRSNDGDRRDNSSQYADDGSFGHGEPMGDTLSSRTKGRPKGSKNKKTLLREQEAAEEERIRIENGLPPPLKRKRGRPKGSKSKMYKGVPVVPSTTTEPSTGSSTGIITGTGTGTGTGSSSSSGCGSGSGSTTSSTGKRRGRGRPKGSLNYKTLRALRLDNATDRATVMTLAGMPYNKEGKEGEVVVGTGAADTATATVTAAATAAVGGGAAADTAAASTAAAAGGGGEL
jgi:hypothetical protein